MQLEHVLYVSWGDDGGYSIGNVFLSPDDPDARYYEILPQRIPEDFKKAFLSACSKQNAVPNPIPSVLPLAVQWKSDMIRVGKAFVNPETFEIKMNLDADKVPKEFMDMMLGNDISGYSIYNPEKDTNVCDCEVTNHPGTPCGGGKCHCHEDEEPPMESPGEEKTYFSITFDSVNVADINDIVTAARQAAGWPKSYGTYCAPITEDD